MVWMESLIEGRGGEVGFAEFMELALYDSEHGYYNGAVPRYGRRGDFLTAPTASPWYAAVVSSLMTRLTDRIGPVTLVDLAAGDGCFLAGVYEALGGRVAGVIRRLVAVDRAGPMRDCLAKRLPGVAEVVADLRQAGPPNGPVVIHASELYDALPVERVIAGGEGLEELRVASIDGVLMWRRRPAGAEAIAYFSGHRIRLEPGQIAEACLMARDLHRRHLQWAGDDALMLILDYGYEARRLYDARGRRNGSLACYRRHQLSRDPLESPGEQDITAHVNWDDLRAPAEAVGWQEVGLWPLAEFLVRAGLARVVEGQGLGIEAPVNAQTIRERQEIKRLLDPDGMGSDLKMLIQGRGRFAECPEFFKSSG